MTWVAPARAEGPKSNNKLLYLYQLYYLPFAVALAILLRLAASLHRTAIASPLVKRRMMMVLATFCLGPGLFVNLLLKAHSGRPRPFQTDLFGGAMTFRPAGSFDGACTGNCSFVSGEAAGSVWLLCALALLPEDVRRRASPFVIVMVAVGASLRMMFGRHYLSDVVLGGLSSLVVFAVLRAAFGWRASPKSHQ